MCASQAFFDCTSGQWPCVFDAKSAHLHPSVPVSESVITLSPRVPLLRSVSGSGEWHPEAFTCQAFNAECHPVGFKDGGLDCRCWVSRVMNGEMIREVECEVVSGGGGGIEQWRDRWGMGRWVKNKSRPSHPIPLLDEILLLCLTPCMAIFLCYSDSAPPPPPPLSSFFSQ